MKKTLINYWEVYLLVAIFGVIWLLAGCSKNKELPPSNCNTVKLYYNRYLDGNWLDGGLSIKWDRVCDSELEKFKNGSQWWRDSCAANGIETYWKVVIGSQQICRQVLEHVARYDSIPKYYFVVLYDRTISDWMTMQIETDSVNYFSHSDGSTYCWRQ